MNKVLIISGYDPTSGAGLSADLRACVSLGVFPLPVPSVLTLQTDKGLEGIERVGESFFRRALEIALSCGVDAVKVGLLTDPEKARVIKDCLSHAKYPLVLDPVLYVSKGGYRAESEVVEAILDFLVPISTIVTPNVEELEALSGTGDPEVGSHFLIEKGAEAVLVKGVESGGRALDLLFLKDRTLEIERDLVKGDFHGTGCALSSLIASLLASGLGVVGSVLRASQLIRESLSIPVRLRDSWFSPRVTLRGEKARVVYDLLEAFLVLKEKGNPAIIPEVGSNFCYAVSSPRGIEDVAGFPSRIINYRKRIFSFSYPEFGGSWHVARALLSAMKKNRYVRSCMNIAYREDFVERAKRLGYGVVFVDRMKEPEGPEGKSMEWITSQAFSTLGSADVVYDKGSVGKEPMMRVFGVDPFDVVDKVLRITGG